MAFFKLDIKYKSTLLDTIREAQARVVETRSLLRAIAERVRYSFQLNILQSRTPDGQEFKPLVLPIRKKVLKTDPRPLIDSGTLVSSFEYEFRGDRTVVIGDPTRYGIFQNFGTKTIPARTFIGIRPDDKEDIDRILGNWAGWVFGVYDAPDANVFIGTKRIH